jgi:RNA polymerase sigma-70 factor (ECF subfamily)
MTDEQLIEAFRESGDPAALDALVGRHIGRIRAMTYAMVLNDADADDLTQEVFLRVVNHIGRFRARSSFSTWLHRVAMNTVHDHLRKRRRDRTACRVERPDAPDPAAAPPDRLMDRETDALVFRALAGLAPALRAAFTLVVLQELPPREAAGAEGCFLSTLYRRIDAARDELRRNLRGVL